MASDGGSEPPATEVGGDNLRSVPRQARSGHKITALLDAAEQVIERLGIDNATTNDIAQQAGVSVGSVYYWFADMDAVLQALTERNRDAVAAFLQASFVEAGDLTSPQLIMRIVDEFVGFARANPATMEIIEQARSRTDTPESPHDGSTYELLRSLIEQIVDARVADTTPLERRVVATAAAGLLLSMTTAILSAPDPTTEAALRQETVYSLAAYLAARYPDQANPVWDEPERFIRPARPSRNVPMDEPVIPFS